MQGLPQEENQDGEQKEMNVKGILQTPDGTYEVTVQLNSDQHKFIFEAGLGFLLSAGALPIAVVQGAKLEEEEQPTIEKNKLN